MTPGLNDYLKTRLYDRNNWVDCVKIVKCLILKMKYFMEEYVKCGLLLIIDPFIND